MNSEPLSYLMHLMVMLNSVWIIDAKDLMRDDASDFNFMRNNQANLVL